MNVSEFGGGDRRSPFYQLAGFEMRRDTFCAEPGSVGLLTWEDGAGAFKYLDGSWLRSFARHNWRQRESRIV